MKQYLDLLHRIAVRTVQYMPDYMKAKIIESNIARCNRLTELEADDKARALHLRPYITLGTKAGSTDLENAEKD